MKQDLPSEIAEGIKRPFQEVAADGDFGVIVNEIARGLAEGTLTSKRLSSILSAYNTSLTAIRDDLLNMLLSYIDHILDDHVITEFEAKAMTFLKRFFRIREGDFYRHKHIFVEDIINRQLEYMFMNNRIDPHEALQKVALQGLFDLSYDQFLAMGQRSVKKALDRGADILALDTFIKLDT
ncbi:MAG TPA: hypothetical protein VIK80_14860 [Flavihumibacter sp.]|jgi:hypothetical protein